MTHAGAYREAIRLGLIQRDTPEFDRAVAEVYRLEREQEVANAR